MNWQDLSQIDKQQFRDRAVKIIYPGLEPVYREHEKMVACLARALHRVAELSKV